MSAPQPVVYRIDAKDRLEYVNDAWDAFARANEGESLVGERVRMTSLWDYLSDGPTRQVYGDLLSRVRSGKRARFQFRCDSPAMRRLLSMQMITLGFGAVEFSVTALKLEPRAPQALLDPRAPRGDRLIRICAWCKKAHVEGAWLEIEEAVAKTDWLRQPVLPQLTHGMCEACESRMSKPGWDEGV